MGSWVAVDDLDALSGHHAHYVWMVPASTLIEFNRLVGNREGPVAQALLHVHEHIGQMAVGRDNVFRFVRALAVRILAHVNRSGLWRSAFKLDRAANRCRRSRINRGRCGRRRGATGGRLLRGFLLATPREQEHRAYHRESGVCRPDSLFHVSPLKAFWNSQLQTYLCAPWPAP